MIASAEVARHLAAPDFAAKLLTVPRLRAASTWSALTFCAPPLNHEETESPNPVLRKRSTRPLNPPPCSSTNERSDERRVVTLLLLMPNLLPASLRTASSAPIVPSILASPTGLHLKDQARLGVR